MATTPQDVTTGQGGDPAPVFQPARTADEDPFTAQDPGELYQAVLEAPYWRHRIDLGDGRFTPGKVDARTWGTLGLPDDLSGRSFLDVGAFDGLYSFLAEERGADPVLATDIWSDPPDDESWWSSLRPTDRGIRLARALLGSEIGLRTIPVQELTPEAVGTWDVVLCSGVLYHLKDPFASIEALAGVTDERLVVETAAYDIEGGPRMEFHPTDELDGNPSNWWVPNEACLRAMLEAAGAHRVEFHRKDGTGEAPPIPEPEQGHALRDVDLHRSPELADPVGRIPRGEPVTRLAERGGAVRIEYRQEGDAWEQGWVHGDAVTRLAPDVPLHERVRRIHAAGGLEAVAEAARERFGAGRRRHRLVAHAYF